MTTDADTGPEQQAEHTPEQVESAAERIAEEATDVRERIRSLLTDAVHGQKGAISDLRRTADAVLAGVARGVKNAGGSQREGVLNEAIAGLSDGVSRSVNATRLALREAEGRGQRFVDEDLARTIDDLRTIEQLFEDTLKRFISSVTSESKSGAEDLREHAEHATKDARADISSALSALAEHPTKAAGEAASAAADVAKQGVGSLFQIASGLLDAATDVASPRDDTKKR